MFDIVVQNTVVRHKVAAFDENIFVYNPFKLHIMLLFSVSKSRVKSTDINSNFILT